MRTKAAFNEVFNYPDFFNLEMTFSVKGQSGI